MRADTRLGVALLAVTVASGAVLALGAWLADVPGAAGVPHARIPAMLQGGEGAVPGPAALALGGLFGALQIAFFGLCFALGMRRGGSLGALARPVACGTAGYLAVWVAVVVSYAYYASAPAASPRLLGFPLPTALLLFALWPFPVYFVALYLRGFAAHGLGDADFERFRARLRELESEERGRGGEGR